MDIWVGGRSEGALKRTARLGDGFFASFQTPEEFQRSMSTIRHYAESYGRACEPTVNRLRRLQRAT